MDSRLQHRVQRDGWDLAATAYEPLWQDQLAAVQSALLARAAPKLGECVLDVACGTGLVTLPAARAVGPNGQVHGVDIAERMVDTLRTRPSRRACARSQPRAWTPSSCCCPTAASTWCCVRWAPLFEIVDAEGRSEVCPMFFGLGQPGALPGSDRSVARRRGLPHPGGIRRRRVAGTIDTMSTTEPFFREAGAGPGVVCLHANASSSAQWRALMERLAPTHHVLAPDLYGAGKSPDWPSDRVISLADEAAFIEPVLQRAGSPLTLVAHSHGAAVALRIAAENPARVRALALYEPTLFSLIEAEGPSPNEADGIREVVAAAGCALDAGDPDAAAAHFIDYWTGPGSWAATSDTRRPAMAASVRAVRRWAHALMHEPTPLSAFAALPMPVLLMSGSGSTVAAHGVTRRLSAALRQVRHVEFPSLGHMGPVTHPDHVNEAIVRFLLAGGASPKG